MIQFITAFNWRDCHHHLRYYLVHLVHPVLLVGCFHLDYYFLLVKALPCRYHHLPICRTINLLLIIRSCHRPCMPGLLPIYWILKLLIFELLVVLIVLPWLSLVELAVEREYLACLRNPRRLRLTLSDARMSKDLMQSAEITYKTTA